MSNAVHWSSQVHRIHGTDSRVFFPDVQTAIEFYHPEDRQFVSNSVEAAVQNQLPFDFRLRLIRADGAERQVHSIGYPEVVSGEVVGIFGVFQDVTERDRWLRERNRELERFAYAAAHDLQAPLRTALGLVQLLKEDGGTNWSPEAEDVLGRLSVHAVRMNHLVAAMHRYASVSEEVRFESIDLERVVTEVWSEFQGELDGQRIEFDRLPCVRGDRRLLKEAFRTLISNSLKFQSESMLQVRVSAQKDGPFWQISVADNGIGFPQTEATRALSLFKQLHRPGTYPGLGMGLPLCKRIIEQHGGTLEITSALGAGTTVRFRLASATEQSLNPSVPPSRMV
ncbi:MAG: ATP-binding protein [Myxococcota bacterium]